MTMQQVGRLDDALHKLFEADVADRSEARCRKGNEWRRGPRSVAASRNRLRRCLCPILLVTGTFSSSANICLRANLHGVSPACVDDLRSI